MSMEPFDAYLSAAELQLKRALEAAQRTLASDQPVPVTDDAVRQINMLRGLLENIHHVALLSDIKGCAYVFEVTKKYNIPTH